MADYGGYGGGMGVGGGGTGMQVQTSKIKVWAEDCFASEFCDHFAEDVIGGSDILHNYVYYGRAIDHLLVKIGNGSIRPEVGTKVAGCFRRLRQFLERSEGLFRKLQTYMQWKLNFHLSKIVDEVARLIGGMSEGDVCVFPLPTPLHIASIVIEVDPKDPSQCIITIVNPSPFTYYHAKVLDPANPSKLKQNVSMTLSPVPKQKLMSEALWACIFIGSAKLSKDDVLYTHFLEWLTDKPFDASIAGGLAAPSCVYATPAKSDVACHWKSLIHSLKYLMRSMGLSAEEVKYVRFFVKVFLLEASFEDLDSVETIKLSTRKLIESAAQSTATSLARNSSLFEMEQLQGMKRRIEELHTKLMAKVCDDAGETVGPPQLDLNNGWDLAQQCDAFPLWETIRRMEEVDQYAGSKTEIIKSSPVNFFRIPEKISTIQEAISALQDALVLCVRIAEQVQSVGTIKNGVHLAVSMLNRLFILAIPTPLGPKSKKASPEKSCVWSAPITYAQQQFLMRRLHDLCEFYAWLARSGVTDHEQNDGMRMTVFTKMCCISDAVLRNRATDDPSVVSKFYAGDSEKPGFAFTCGQFAKQSSTVVFTTPVALVCRAQILDYFEEILEITPATNILWKWEDSMRGCVGTERFYKLLLQSESINYATDSQVLHFFASNGENRHGVINRYYPEILDLRNIVMFTKHFMSKSVIHDGNFISTYPQGITTSWSEGDQLHPYAFGGYNLPMRGDPRYKSNAIASSYTAPFDVVSEDDLLHIKNLPAFGDEIGQRDAELLYSYLTVPYMRIPLVLRFFSTEDRVSCLRSEAIQTLLCAVLFEPAKFLPASLSSVAPKEVPTENGDLIATPYGVLMNELQTSPEGVLRPLIRLVELAREMDAGTVWNYTATNVILYLITQVARVNNFIAATLEHHEKKNADLRECPTIPAAHTTLKELNMELQTLILTELLPMLEKWIDEAMKTVIDAKSGGDIDASTSLAVKLHGRVLLLLRNVTAADHTADTVSRFISSYIFLTTRYTWGDHQIGNEFQLYEAFACQRKILAMWLTQASVKDVAFVCDSVVRVATSSGTRLDSSGAKNSSAKFEWGLLAGVESLGRFVRLDEELLKRHGRADGREHLSSAASKFFQMKDLPKHLQTVKDGLQDVEINLQTMTLTFKSAHLRAIPQEIAQQDDVFKVFGPLFGDNKNLLVTMQCAMVEDATNRMWVRLVGQDHDIQYWKTSDPRFAIPDDTMRFFPDDLAPNEDWIYHLFEPLRRQSFERSFWMPPIFILLPEAKLSSHNTVAALTAVCSRTGQKLKEMYVFKDFKCCHVYDVFSHGRRFYRSLVYTTDANFCLREMQPSLGARTHPWVAWARHAAGDADPDTSIEEDTTVVILRHPTHTKNISRSIETFIPVRLLHGLLPSALLESHEFWQDEDDNLRGYPNIPKDEKEAKPTHILWIHWKELQFDPLNTKNTCARVFRFAVARSAPRASEEAVLASQKLRLVDAVEEEIEMTRITSEKSEAEQLDAGAFRQSSVVYSTAKDTASIDDHNLLLLNLLYAREGTPLHGLAKVFARVELLSHVLVWTTQTDFSHESTAAPSLDLIHLPRLKLSFAARLGPDAKSYVVYSLDHSHLFISNIRQPLVVDLLQGVPHSLIMSDANDAFSLLVPSINVERPVITTAPFSTELVLVREETWINSLETKYYLYPVHVSLSFLFTPTLASALYLLLLRFLHRSHDDVFRLASSIGTDMAFTVEELQIFKKITSIYDAHPNAHACKSKIALLVADSPVQLDYYTPLEVTCMIAKFSHVAISCRLSQSEERRLLYICKMLESKMNIIREAAEKSKEAYSALFETEIAEAKSSATKEQRKFIRPFVSSLMNQMREKLNVRISREELMRLVLIFQRYCKTPLEPYHTCLLLNRYQIIENELRAKESKLPSIRVTLQLPPMGKDLQWSFYSEFNPLSAKPSFPTPKNEGNNDMEMSPRLDYWYCGKSCRTANVCKCKACDDKCGSNDRCGCPCTNCEKWNRLELAKVRLLPASFEVRSMRTISFYDIFAWMSELFSRYANSKPNDQFPFLNKNPPMSLRESTNGFIRYYELATGSTKAKIAFQDTSKDLITLLFHFSNEARNVASGIGHVAHFLINAPKTHNKLAKFNRNSKSKMEIKVTQIYNSIFEQAAINKTVNETVAAKKVNPNVFAAATTVAHDLIPRPHRRTAEIPLQATTILPSPDNTACNVRTLGLPDLTQLNLLGNEPTMLNVTATLRDALTGHLLDGILPDNFVVFCDRKGQGLDEIDGTLPFDLSKHEYAKKTVAREMLTRIESDAKEFSNRSNKTLAPKLHFLRSLKDARALMTVSRRADIITICATLKALSLKLQALRDEDLKFVAYAFPAATRTANYIDHETNFSSTLLFLRRFAKKEAVFTVEYLIASLCSTTAEIEWQQLNPFIKPATCCALMDLISIAVLCANRVGHVNRICEGIKELENLLKKIVAVMDQGSDGASSLIEAIIASTLQKADSVASMLVTRRVYVEKDFTYDPRFLLFEFTWNLVLRKRQRELVMDTYNSIAIDRKSIVKQMIMGAGKTTVVGPLLGLMLADGTNLVIQVVPPALLDFTRAVLRSTFSTVLQKQIFTFICDRSSDVDSEILSKFEHAKQSRGIVVTTPSSVKSMFLKYVEGLDRIADSTRPRTLELEKEAKDILQVLQMWKSSALIMDEVDLLLHPLKSELNFPIGAKHEIDFTPARWKLPIHLIDAIFYYHTKRITVNMKDSPDAHAVLFKFREAIRAGLRCNAIQEMPHLTLLNLEYYDATLKPILAEWLLLFLKAQHLVGLTDAETVAYIIKRPSHASNKALIDKVEALDPNHVKLLNLAYEWLSCFMPHILQKIDRVSFGIMNNEDIRRAQEEHPNMPLSRFLTAIPFIGKDLPSQSSEFAHPDVVIGLTILAFRYEGLRLTDFTAIMREVHATVEKEVGRFNQRRTNIMFTKWVHAAGGKILSSYTYNPDNKQQTEMETIGTDEMGMQPSESIVFDADSPSSNSASQIQVLPLKLMKQANEDESNKLLKLFKRAAEVIHWYLCESIFPEYMRHQHAKLSASGQELGGNILFDRRVGFSGTPSDLLPVEMGRCGYEVGTDGQLIHTLTDPSVINFSVVEPGWSVRSLLDYIANAQPPFHALIDTGALITGMSNLQVAQYLLKNGLPSIEGAVFLDEFDRKMILVRATGRVLKLAECGIPKVKRFAFYDQVHTTGMDIDHTPNAQAIQTLGKDMTFRDFSQGSYRMRGIGQGQTVQLLIIPEVYDLICRTLVSVRPAPTAEASSRTVRSVLVDVTAWLLVNSIRSEHTQHNQLCLQSCSNIWRKEAFGTLASSVDEFKVTSTAIQPAALEALRVFRETINFDVPIIVPQSRMFSEAVAAVVAPFMSIVRSEAGKAVIAGIMEQTKREDEIDNPVIDVQMVQEQEEEKEAEQEQEKEQEIEIEKFVDVAYSRDEEQSNSWQLNTLRDPLLAVQFYKLADFHLYKRRRIEFPPSIHLSRNYFHPQWSGHRRMKNVIVTMEWVPNSESLRELDQPSQDYASVDPALAQLALARTMNTLKEHRGGISEELLQDLLSVALHTQSASKEQWDHAVKTIQAKIAKCKQDDMAAIAAVIYEALSGNLLRNEQSGRHTVVLSLTEAETVRRAMHLRNVHGKSFLDGSTASIALHIVSSSNALLDKSVGFVDAPSTFQRQQNFQCLRFFDSDLHYTDAEFGLLLRSLHVNHENHRQAFFHQVIACRRRARQRWDRTPVALLFLLKNALTLLHQRVIGLCIYRELLSKELNLGDAFICFNSSHSGVLSPGEVWGAAQFCRLKLTVDDVLDFLDVADTHHEGTIQYPDFLCVLTGSRELEEAEATGGGAGEDKGKNLPVVTPHGEEELHVAQSERSKKRTASEAEANKEMESENQRVMDEIELEQIREEIESLQNAGNPVLSTTSLTFNLDNDKVPKLLNATIGKVCKALDDVAGSASVPNTTLTSNSSLRVSLRCVKHLCNNNPILKEYALTTELKLPRPLLATDKMGVVTKITQQCQTLDLLQWPLSLYVLNLSESLTGFMEERVDQEKSKKAIEKQTAKETKKTDSKAAKLAAAALDVVDVPREGSSFVGPAVNESEDPVNPADEDVAPEHQEAELPEVVGEEEGGGDDDDDDDPSTEKDSNDEGNEEYTRLPIFAESQPDSEIIGYLKEHDVVELGSEKVRTNIDGTTYEWRKLTDPSKPKGWVIFTSGTFDFFKQQAVALRFVSGGSQLQLVVLDYDPADNVVGQILPPGSIDYGSMDGAVVDSDDEGNINDLELFGDVGDLLEALRKAKSLKPGDRVSRNPECWDKGNEDGGNGKIGKVLKVEEASITVQWPSGNKGTYLFGSAGKYELVKVGDADEDDDEGEQREVLNDDRWVSLLKSKGKEKCNQCQAAKLELGDWFHCNQCDNFNLCKKCFKAQNHMEHDFTDMKAISVTDASELGLGSWAKIRMSVEEPKNGWQGASHESRGIVTNIDRDSGTILIDFEADGEFEGLITEVEVTSAPKETDTAAAVAGIRKTPAIDFILSCKWKETISIISEVAKRPTKFMVGDRVRAFRSDYGACYVATIRAVLDKKCTVLFENEENAHEVNEDQIKILPFVMGDKVRVKKSTTNPMYGWSCLAALSDDQKYKKEGKITYIGGGGSDYLYLNVDFDSTQGWTIGLTDGEIELVNKVDKNVKWMMVLPASETRPEEILSVIPSSSSIGIERSFSAGLKKGKFYLKDKNYIIDFEKMEIHQEEDADGAKSKNFDMLSYVAEREPPRNWEHRLPPTNLEDGHWHILTLIVSEKDVVVICDGLKFPLEFTGTVAAKVAMIRTRENALLGTGTVVPMTKPPSAEEPEAEAGDVAPVEDLAAEVAGLFISSFFPLPTTSPMLLMRTEATCETFRQSVGTAVEESYPRRYISKFIVDWRSGPSVALLTIAEHQKILQETSWKCKHCQFSNPRFYEDCDECQEPRVEKKAGKTQQLGKVRAVFPKSREAHQLRQKLQGKLRSQFQKELDAFDHSSAEPRAMRDASPDVL